MAYLHGSINGEHASEMSDAPQEDARRPLPPVHTAAFVVIDVLHLADA